MKNKNDNKKFLGSITDIQASLREISRIYSRFLIWEWDQFSPISKVCFYLMGCVIVILSIGQVYLINDLGAKKVITTLHNQTISNRNQWITARIIKKNAQKDWIDGLSKLSRKVALDQIAKRLGCQTTHLIKQQETELHIKCDSEMKVESRLLYVLMQLEKKGTLDASGGLLLNKNKPLK